MIAPFPDRRFLSALREHFLPEALFRGYRFPAEMPEENLGRPRVPTRGLEDSLGLFVTKKYCLPIDAFADRPRWDHSALLA